MTNFLELAPIIIFREANKDDRDRAFIFSTWLRGLYYGNYWFKEIPKDRFMSFYHNVIEGILNKPNVKVSCAVLKEDPDVILGYAVMERNILHWVFVKQAWRGLHIATKLVPDDIDTVTHMTDKARTFKPKNVVFDPFQI